MKTKRKNALQTTILLKDIPVALRDHFKSWCALRGLTMKEVLIDLMREKINERMKEK